MSIQSIKEDLALWADQPAQPLCMTIIDCMSKLPNQQLQTLTYKSFLNLLGRTNVDVQLISALSILCDDKIAALEAHAWFIDEDENEHELDPVELSCAFATGKLVHPVSGELLSDFTSQLVPYYAASEKFSSGRE